MLFQKAITQRKDPDANWKLSFHGNSNTHSLISSEFRRKHQRDSFSWPKKLLGVFTGKLSLPREGWRCRSKGISAFKSQHITSISVSQEKRMKATPYISTKFPCLLLFMEQVIDVPQASRNC